MSERWYKDNCAAIGLGFMADVREMEHPGKVAKYVTKYMSKAIAVTDWPSGFHRFRFSRLWPEVDDMDTVQVDWRVYLSKAAFDDEMRHFVRLGYRPVNTRTGEIIDG